MYERILEIIIYMITQLKFKESLTEQNLSELHDRGYTKSEISTAFSWLLERMEFAEELGKNDFANESKSFRIFHEAEEHIFTKDAWGELIQLRSLGIISNKHIEKIIDRAIVSGIYKIDTSLIKLFLSDLLFSTMRPLNENMKIFLQGNDTIN